MDITQILPLLLKGEDNSQKANILSAMLGNKNGKGASREDLLMQMLAGQGGGNPEMQAIMNLMKMNQNNQKTSGPKAEGLQIISGFAPPDILGTMYKILAI